MPLQPESGFDFEADANAAKDYVSDDKLKAVSDLANRQLQLEREISEAEGVLDQLNKRLRNIKTVEIPTAMDEAGVQEFVTSDGYKITLKDKLKASVLKDNKPRAFQYMREIGFGSLVKNQIVVQFGMKQDDKATALMKELESKGLPVTQKQDVHAATMTKFVKERMEAGESLPAELFNIFQYRESVIKRKK